MDCQAAFPCKEAAIGFEPAGSATAGQVARGDHDIHACASGRQGALGYLVAISRDQNFPIPLQAIQRKPTEFSTAVASRPFRKLKRRLIGTGKFEQVLLRVSALALPQDQQAICLVGNADIAAITRDQQIGNRRDNDQTSR